MNWQEYEKQVFEHLSVIYPDAKLEFNSKLFGKYSNGLRQCDVVIRQIIGDIEYVTLVDAKYYSDKIDVKDVETFISMANDINANYGILVSPKGYSELAYNRAENDPLPVLLDILTLEDLKQFQCYCAIPYAGENGLLLFPAFGWIIDITQRFEMIASSYRKGFGFEEAFKEREFIYFQIWDTKKDPILPENLLLNQEYQIRERLKIKESEIKKIEYGNKSLMLRKTISENYLAVEYACAIEYDGFIFFGVLISPVNRETVNKNKLVQMVAKAVPIKVIQK
ncbi:Restriction endonuclease [Flexibacter flexilis DSM 6793]|uniref:Restriction endonuclease n=1 Tax=Flexibacter flexilis DSM 6793 TaxID=927664 RepID=A0A1I1D6V0_9BACT|nr:restriction endonuclease [Flexibacter flexilis]SFB70547.1 Restriction endonuclease [Flexibacter flexilis DSM 6793]